MLWTLTSHRILVNFRFIILLQKYYAVKRDLGSGLPAQRTRVHYRTHSICRSCDCLFSAHPKQVQHLSRKGVKSNNDNYYYIIIILYVLDFCLVAMHIFSSFYISFLKYNWQRMLTAKLADSNFCLKMTATFFLCTSDINKRGSGQQTDIRQKDKQKKDLKNSSQKLHRSSNKQHLKENKTKQFFLKNNKYISLILQYSILYLQNPLPLSCYLWQLNLLDRELKRNVFSLRLCETSVHFHAFQLSQGRDLLERDQSSDNMQKDRGCMLPGQHEDSKNMQTNC